MHWDQIEDRWQQYRGQVKEKWGELTDDELDAIAGKRHKLIDKLQEKRALSRDEAERQLEEWQRYVRL
jgi:uncharacterized protein YjbJ (UPF0337 family)